LGYLGETRILGNDTDEQIFEGESLELWRSQSIEVCSLVELFSAMRFSPSKLEKVFSVVGDRLTARYGMTPHGFRSHHLHRSDPTSQQYDRTLMMNNHLWRDRLGPLAPDEEFSPDPRLGLTLESLGLTWGHHVNSISAAEHYIASRVNDALEGAVGFGLIREGRAGWFDQFVCRPLTLHAAIFLHFALELVGRRTETRLCANPNCDNEFPKSGKRIYCSSKCDPKRERYRQRQIASTISTIGSGEEASAGQE
jgi:hypothetical protein